MWRATRGLNRSVCGDTYHFWTIVREHSIHEGMGAMPWHDGATRHMTYSDWMAMHGIRA